MICFCPLPIPFYIPQWIPQLWQSLVVYLPSTNQAQAYFFFQAQGQPGAATSLSIINNNAFDFILRDGQVEHMINRAFSNVIIIICLCYIRTCCYFFYFDQFSEHQVANISPFFLFFPLSYLCFSQLRSENAVTLANCMLTETCGNQNHVKFVCATQDLFFVMTFFV